MGVRLAAAVLRSAYGVPAASTAEGPHVVSATTDGAATPTVRIAIAAADGSGVALIDGQECVACCAAAADTVLFGLAVDGPWSKSLPVRFEGGTTLVATAAAPGAFTHVALGVADYPQCAPVSVSNGFPLAPAVLRLTPAAAA